MLQWASNEPDILVRIKEKDLDADFSFDTNN